MTELDRRDPLRIGPPFVYPTKALLTRARSAWWIASRGGGASSGGLRILFYHRVAGDRDELAVSPRAFAEQMASLAHSGFRALDIDQALGARGDVDEPIVGLSFDDGYRDVLEHAVPVLERHGFSATVFVTTGVAAGRATFPWYDHTPPVLSPAEIAELDGGTLSFEAHTVTHPNLLRLDEAAARTEIVESRVELEGWLGRPVRGFSYPAGLLAPHVRDLVEAAGFAWAATCEPGVNRLEDDPLLLRRIQINARDSVLDVRAKFLGGHDRPLPGRALYRRLRYRGLRAASSLR